MIAIVDYQAGNLASVRKAFDHLGHESAITSDPETIARAEKFVLPGVGNFEATTALSGPLREAIVATPSTAISLCSEFVSVCSGCLSPARKLHNCVVWACSRASARSFPPTVKSPHVGWNQLRLRGDSRLLRGLPQDSFVYFTHSYRAPLVDATVGDCAYGGAFSAAVERGQLFGVQFHPEKSGPAGLQLLRNFCEL